MISRALALIENLEDALLKPVNPTAIIILGFYTVLWGFWIANPFWSVFAMSHLFSVFGIFPPQYNEVFWGCLAMVCGAVSMYGAIRRRYKPLVRGAATLGWHWTMIAIFYFIGAWTSPAGITALAMATYAAYIWINVRVNHKYLVKDHDLFVS